MTYRPHLALLASLCAASLAGGCGPSGSYRLSWTIGCARVSGVDCEVDDAKDCARAGFDAIEVRTRPAGGAESSRVLYPCFDRRRGPIAEGPDLDAGATLLFVTALDARGQGLSGPLELPAAIPEEGLVNVEVDLPLAPACADGVDNDGDGAVDLFDPQCEGEADTDEEI